MGWVIGDHRRQQRTWTTKNWASCGSLGLKTLQKNQRVIRSPVRQVGCLYKEEKAKGYSKTSPEITFKFGMRQRRNFDRKKFIFTTVWTSFLFAFVWSYTQCQELKKTLSESISFLNSERGHVVTCCKNKKLFPDFLLYILDNVCYILYYIKVTKWRVEHERIIQVHLKPQRHTHLYYV